MNDPINRTTDSSRELFKRMAPLATGFPHDVVIDAALNLVVNAVRQSHPRGVAADHFMRDRMERVLQILSDCYDSNGNRKSIFPFHQHVLMEHFNTKDKI